MSAIPLKLLKLKTLMEVPRSEFSDLNVPEDLSNENVRLGFLKMLRQKPKKIKSTTNSKSRELSFNAAVWLNFAEVVRKPVSLWLTYKDAQGENTILVDEQLSGDSMSAMLSGNVSFKVTGNIEYLRACCAGVDSNKELVVEEVHVTRLKNEVTYLNSIQQMA
jgi:hypothetical protein